MDTCRTPSPHPHMGISTLAHHELSGTGAPEGCMTPVVIAPLEDAASPQACSTPYIKTEPKDDSPARAGTPPTSPLHDSGIVNSSPAIVRPWESPAKKAPSPAPPTSAAPVVPSTLPESLTAVPPQSAVYDEMTVLRELEWMHTCHPSDAAIRYLYHVTPQQLAQMAYERQMAIQQNLASFEACKQINAHYELQHQRLLGHLHSKLVACKMAYQQASSLISLPYQPVQPAPACTSTSTGSPRRLPQSPQCVNDSGYMSSPATQEKKEFDSLGRRMGCLPPHAVRILKMWYRKNFDHPYADSETISRLAAECGLTRAQVRKWMANQRMRSHNTLSFNGTVHPKRLQKQRRLLNAASTVGPLLTETTAHLQNHLQQLASTHGLNALQAAFSHSVNFTTVNRLPSMDVSARFSQ